MKIVGQKLPPRKFKNGDQITRSAGGLTMVAVMIQYHAYTSDGRDYINLRITSVSIVYYNCLVGRTFDEPADWWEKV